MKSMQAREDFNAPRYVLSDLCVGQWWCICFNERLFKLNEYENCPFVVLISKLAYNLGQ